MTRLILPYAVALVTAVLLASCGGGGAGPGQGGTPSSPSSPGSADAGLSCLRNSTWFKAGISKNELKAVTQFALASLDCKPTEAAILKVTSEIH